MVITEDWSSHEHGVCFSSIRVLNLIKTKWLSVFLNVNSFYISVNRYKEHPAHYINFSILDSRQWMSHRIIICFKHNHCVTKLSYYGFADLFSYLLRQGLVHILHLVCCNTSCLIPWFHFWNVDFIYNTQKILYTYVSVFIHKRGTELLYTSCMKIVAA